MADFRELFTSDDFAAYQDKLVDVMVGWFHNALFKRSQITMDTVREVASLSEQILEIPGEMFSGPGDDIGQRLKARINSYLIKIPATVLRKQLMKP